MRFIEVLIVMSQSEELDVDTMDVSMDVEENEKLTEIPFVLGSHILTDKNQDDFIFCADKYNYVKFNNENVNGVVTSSFVQAYTSKNKNVNLPKDMIDSLIVFVENTKLMGVIVLMIHQRKNKIIVMDIIKSANIQFNEKSYGERIKILQEFNDVVEVNGKFEIKVDQESYKLKVTVINNITFNKNINTFCRKKSEVGLKMTKYYIKDSANRIAIGRVTVNEKKKSNKGEIVEKNIDYILIVDSVDEENRYVVNGIGKYKGNISSIQLTSKPTKYTYILPDCLKSEEIHLYEYPITVQTGMKFKLHPTLKIPILDIYKNSGFVQEKDKIYLQKIDINENKINDRMMEILMKFDDQTLFNELYYGRGITLEMYEQLKQTISTTRQLNFMHLRQSIYDKMMKKDNKNTKSKISPVAFESVKHPSRFIIFSDSTEDEIIHNKIKFKRLSSLVNNDDGSALIEIDPQFRAKLAIVIKYITKISMKYNEDDKDLYIQTYNSILNYIPEEKMEKVYIQDLPELVKILKREKLISRKRKMDFDDTAPADKHKKQ